MSCLSIVDGDDYYDEAGDWYDELPDDDDDNGDDNDRPRRPDDRTSSSRGQEGQFLTIFLSFNTFALQ